MSNNPLMVVVFDHPFLRLVEETLKQGVIDLIEIEAFLASRSKAYSVESVVVMGKDDLQRDRAIVESLGMTAVVPSAGEAQTCLIETLLSEGLLASSVALVGGCSKYAKPLATLSASGVRTYVVGTLSTVSPSLLESSSVFIDIADLPLIWIPPVFQAPQLVAL
jgi:hypothetical protein